MSTNFRHAEKIIEIQELSKSFGATPILVDITMSIPKGSITGIIGKSGAGKTTLLRCMNFLEKPDKGSFKIEGKECFQATGATLRSLRQKMGMVFQSINLLRNRTVEENIALPLEFMNISKAEITKKVNAALTLLALNEKRNVYPANLSGGQKQRVAIARALIGQGNILLCDEFTSALDPETTLETLGLLGELNKTLDVTIIIVTHDMMVIREICDFVYVIDKGKCIEAGRVEDIFYAPQQIVTKSLIRTSIERDIPSVLKDRMIEVPQKGCDALVRLIFASDSSQNPVISEVVREFGISINIIAGSLDHFRESTLGTLLITFPYHKAKYPEVIAFLQKQRVQPELLGYLKGKT
ncbi:MAG: methionine ABC transporter ATP-binding protein [Proteobacteria bacterium]|nr:methionine ABC transporter ATP-binding protein [Pseudomonadota bacterium]